MQRSRGFTLIELLITISIMVILMSLAVAGLRTSMIKARDDERKNDAMTIARGLEQYYLQGDPKHGFTKGHYPGIDEIFFASGFTVSKPGFPVDPVPNYITTEMLPGAKKDAFYFTDIPTQTFGLINWWGTQAEDSANIAASTTTSKIVYEPLAFYRADFWGPDRWQHCVGFDCQRFNLYYRTEADNQIHTIKSERQ